jgi:phage gpG-like protein
MAKPFIEIKKQIAEVRARLKAQQDWLREKSAPLARMSVQLYRSVMLNFQTESSDEGNRWKPFSAETLLAKANRAHRPTTSPKLLQDTGFMRMSVFPGVTEDSAYASENVDYARYHQFGTEHIPKRPFFTIRRTQLARIKTIARVWAFTGRTEQ